MATLLKVYRSGSRELLYTQLYPDDVAPERAVQLAKDYIHQEGLNAFFALDFKTQHEVDYNDYAHAEPQVYGVSPGQDAVVHLAKGVTEKDRTGTSFCRAELHDLFVSKIVFRNTCNKCAVAVGLISQEDADQAEVAAEAPPAHWPSPEEIDNNLEHYWNQMDANLRMGPKTESKTRERVDMEWDD